MQIILRFGALGDVVTAISLAESESLDLAYSTGYKDFVFGGFKMGEGSVGKQNLHSLLTSKRNVHFVDLAKLRKLIKTEGYSEVLIFVQTTTFPMKIISMVIALYCNIRVSFVDETLQWLIPLKRQLTHDFINNMPTIFNKKIPIIIIAWDGKESSKNLNKHTIESICKHIFSINKMSNIKIIGKSEMQINCFESKVVNLSGSTSMKEMIDCIKESDLLIGCDSGPLHVANYFHVPTISIISARIPRGRWAVIGKNTALVTDFFIRCRYCSSIKCPKEVNYCVNGKVIMQQIDYIFSSIKKLINR